jgi:hypothetical protein
MLTDPTNEVKNNVIVVKDGNADGVAPQDEVEHQGRSRGTGEDDS